MNDLNPETRVRPGQLLGVFAVTVMFLILLLASVIAGGAAARSAAPGFTDEDGRRTAPLVIEPTDSLRKVQLPAVNEDRVLVDLCAGQGLIRSDVETAAELQSETRTYCYPRALLAGERVDDSFPQGRLAGQVDE